MTSTLARTAMTTAPPVIAPAAPVLLLKATDLAIWYTATVTYPEAGGRSAGPLTAQGWYDQDWSAAYVFDSRDSVRADTPAPDLAGTPHGVPLAEVLPGGSPVAWLAARLSARLGAVADYTGGGTVQAAGEATVCFTGELAGTTARVAAHPVGFSDAMIAAAVRRAQARP